MRSASRRCGRIGSTREAAVELGLAEGSAATVLVKSAEFMLGVDD
ncbi:hypothetical protein [Mycobacterium sp. 236(2023)]|nr:hypothetical protein [Mycobacterium sp. 236(2023)]MDG4669279.1 hypothetical protein [Mycobacterium sp. 236(2023)]